LCLPRNERPESFIDHDIAAEFFLKLRSELFNLSKRLIPFERGEPLVYGVWNERVSTEGGTPCAINRSRRGKSNDLFHRCLRVPTPCRIASPLSRYFYPSITYYRQVRGMLMYRTIIDLEKDESVKYRPCLGIRVTPARPCPTWLT